MRIQGATGCPVRQLPTLTPLNEGQRADHVFLAALDQCAFLSHYQGGEGFRGGRCNQLMRNFKCEPSVARRDGRRGCYKKQAIKTLACWLRRALTREQAERCTWVPVPPSRRRGDPDFDDRLLRTLDLAFQSYDIDVREVLYQSRSTGSDHRATSRLSTDELYELLRLDSQTLAQPVREQIVLFDDLLTSGKHFKCCERRLREALPGVPIVGLFLMRRALPRARRGLGNCGWTAGG